MRACGSSYIGGRRFRQSRSIAPLIAVMTLGLTLGGCAGMGLPFEAAATGQRPAATLVSARVSDGVDPSDWEMVRRTIAAAPAGAADGSHNWTNPATGSAGTVTTLGGSDDANCRAFAATVHDLRGVRGYRGEACAAANGGVKLSRVVADDGALL
jgi:hypothetical protein